MMVMDILVVVFVKNEALGEQWSMDLCSRTFGESSMNGRILFLLSAGEGHPELDETGLYYEAGR